MCLLAAVCLHFSWLAIKFPFLIYKFARTRAMLATAAVCACVGNASLLLKSFAVRKWAFVAFGRVRSPVIRA